MNKQQVTTMAGIIKVKITVLTMKGDETKRAVVETIDCATKHSLHTPFCQGIRGYGCRLGWGGGGEGERRGRGLGEDEDWRRIGGRGGGLERNGVRMEAVGDGQVHFAAVARSCRWGHTQAPSKSSGCARWFRLLLQRQLRRWRPGFEMPSSQSSQSPSISLQSSHSPSISLQSSSQSSSSLITVLVPHRRLITVFSPDHSPQPLQSPPQSFSSSVPATALTVPPISPPSVPQSSSQSSSPGAELDQATCVPV